MKKDTFILQTGYKKLFSMLSDEEAGQVIKAVFDYEAEECPAQLEGAALMLFTVICEQLDKYRESYEKTCEANRKNGSKGGRPSGPAETQENPEKPSNSRPAEQEPKEDTKNPKKPKKPNGLSEKPKKPNGDDNELDLDSDSDRDKEKKREKDPPKSPQGVFEGYAGENKELLELLRDYEKMRSKSKAPLTERGKKLLIGELDKLSAGYRASDRYKITLLGEAILHNWKSVYGLKSFADDPPLPPSSQPVPDVGRPGVDLDKASWEDLVE